jgi:hypothetical protein
MTRRHTHVLLGTIAALLLVSVVASIVLWPRTAITRENALKIRVSMTLQEVEELLGGPARDETNDGLGLMTIDIYTPRPRAGRASTHRWQTWARMVEVDLDGDNVVVSYLSGYPSDHDLSLVDKARRWLGVR